MHSLSDTEVLRRMTEKAYGKTGRGKGKQGQPSPVRGKSQRRKVSSGERKTSAEKENGSFRKKNVRREESGGFRKKNVRGEGKRQIPEEKHLRGETVPDIKMPEKITQEEGEMGEGLPGKRKQYGKNGWESPQS